MKHGQRRSTVFGLVAKKPTLGTGFVNGSTIYPDAPRLARRAAAWLLQRDQCAHSGLFMPYNSIVISMTARIRARFDMRGTGNDGEQ